jgi:hypothetical protein
MKIFDFIALSNCGSETCQQCIYFQNDPDLIEKMYPGLTALSSGYASVRDQDGLCSYNQVYLAAGDSCTHFSHYKKGDVIDKHKNLRCI